MTIGYTDTQHYGDIADAIRYKGGTGTFTPAQMAAAIRALPTGSGVNWGNIAGIKIIGPTSNAPVDLSTLDTSTFTSMYGMFDMCGTITSLDLSGWDTSNVTTMASMFNSCSRLTSVNLSGFDTSSVTAMESMFSYCTALTSLDLSGFDTSNVTLMTSMFSYCMNLTSVNLSGFETSRVVNLNNMFRNCNALAAIIWSQKPTVQPIPKSAADIIPTGATVYVPDDLVSAYQADTNWSTISSRIAGISDLPATYKTLYGIQ